MTLVSFIAGDEQRALAGHLAEFCEESYFINRPAYQSAAFAALNFWRDAPLQTLYYYSRQMQQTLRMLLDSRDFDAAYVHLFRMAPYLRDHPEIYRILDLTDLISTEVQASLPYQNRFWRAIYQVEGQRIARFESTAAQMYDEVWFISENDGNLLPSGVARDRIHIVPSEIDEVLFEVAPRMDVAPKLIFLGNLDVRHNIDAATFLVREIMPLIRQVVADCTLNIVGAGNAQNVIGLEKFPEVRVLGFVPDLPKVLGDASVSVAPLRFSAGIQFKVIEAMAAGLPVVATSSVNAGLGAAPGQDLLLGDDAETIAGHVVRLLSDDVFRRNIGDAGRQYVKTHFSVQAANERLRVISSKLDA